MGALIDTEIEGLKFQKRGVFVGTNEQEHLNYRRMRDASESKERELAELKNKFDALNEKFDTVLSLLTKQYKGK